VPEPIGDPNCPQCGGAGWVRVEDGAGGAARPCACRAGRLIPALVDAAGIPPCYRDCTLQGFRTHTPKLLEARAAVKRYLDEFVGLDGRSCETGLLFVGPPGTGKTHLAAAVLAELVRRLGLRGRFVDFTSLVHRIQSTFDPASPESKHDVLDPVIDAQLLVLDELGAQKPTPFVVDTLYLVLNTRYTRKLPTLFTTNYHLGRTPPPRGTDLDLLSSRIPPMLVSRLHEMAKPVLLEAGDYREQVAAVGREVGRGGA
jgi:DNA replication protein DnaC